jgi:hypothetical protein
MFPTYSKLLLVCPAQVCPGYCYEWVYFSARLNTPSQSAAGGFCMKYPQRSIYILLGLSSLAMSKTAVNAARAFSHSFARYKASAASKRPAVG